MKKRILVAGGTGYIGSHTTVELQSAGYEVVTIDGLPGSNIEVLDGTEKITGTRPEFIQLDLKNEEGTRKTLEARPGIRGIVLFAASKAVGGPVQQPSEYYRNNIITLVSLLEMMPEFNIEDIAFSSSCAVYGQPDPGNSSATENAPIKPAMSPYRDTKQINEEIIRDVIHAGAPFRSVILCYSNPTGAHPSAEIGELSNGVSQNLIPHLMQTAMSIRKELDVFGDDHDTTGGSYIRDYISIVDLAKVHITVAGHMLENKSDEHIGVLNLGTGNGASALELVNTFEQTAGVRVPYKTVGRREGDTEKVWANPEHANRVLDWTAKKTLVDTLQSTWNWQRRLRERGIQ